MAIDLYNIGPRVKYGDFVRSTLAVVRAIVSPHAFPGYSVTLSISGSTASIAVRRESDAPKRVEGITLTMPAYSMDRIVTGKWARTLFGYLLHECAHAVLSDTVVYGQFAGKLTNGGGSFLNATEDYFIEYKACEPGKLLIANVAGMLGSLNDDVLTVQPGELDERPTVQGMQFLLASLNRKGRQGNALAVHSQIQPMPEVRAIIEKLMGKLETHADGSTPVEAVDLQHVRLTWGTQAWKALEALEAQQPPSAGAGAGAGAGGSATNALRELANRVKQALENAAPQDVSYSEMEQARHEAVADILTNDQMQVDNSNIQRKSGNRLQALHVAKQCDASRLADMARRALRATDNALVTHRLQSGRMDRRSIVRAGLGARDVYSRRTVTPAIKTGVVLMVDMSGSMGYQLTVSGMDVQRAQACIGVASAVAPALERAGVQVAVAGFGSQAPSAFQGKCVWLWKGFDMRDPKPTTFASTFGDIEPWGNTPMLIPARWAEKLIAPRNVTRRVVIWLCDGSPDESSDTVKGYLTRPGAPVEHVGIGLDCDISDTFGRSVSVTDYTKLPDLMRELLE